VQYRVRRVVARSISPRVRSYLDRGSGCIGSPAAIPTALTAGVGAQRFSRGKLASTRSPPVRLDDLTPRERHVVNLRFGLDGEDERTLEEIGRSLELTRERVRQICAEALDKLNRATRARGLDL
jgi:DNA-binding CsgD family transcriptional regulator